MLYKEIGGVVYLEMRRDEEENKRINPDHYKKSKIEAIDAIEACVELNPNKDQIPCQSNILKYIWRYPMKNKLEDLKKARWYLDRLIKKLEDEA